jgi:mRNA-degrading endonuclease RelE of RelBE toxin-antitoxin system
MSSTYEVEFTRAAERELKKILRTARRADKNNLRDAVETLKSNPYPSNPKVSAGVIRKLSNGEWRITAGTEFRIRYRVQDRRVVITKVANRRDVYRDIS